MLKRLGSHSVQTVAAGATEAVGVSGSVVAEDVVEGGAVPSPPHEDFVVDSEEVVGAESLQILSIEKTTKLLPSLQTSL